MSVARERGETYERSSIRSSLPDTNADNYLPIVINKSFNYLISTNFTSKFAKSYWRKISIATIIVMSIKT